MVEGDDDKFEDASGTQQVQRGTSCAVLIYRTAVAIGLVIDSILKKQLT